MKIEFSITLTQKLLHLSSESIIVTVDSVKMLVRTCDMSTADNYRGSTALELEAILLGCTDEGMP